MGLLDKWKAEEDDELAEGKLVVPPSREKRRNERRSIRMVRFEPELKTQSSLRKTPRTTRRDRNRAANKAAKAARRRNR